MHFPTLNQMGQYFSLFPLLTHFPDIPEMLLHIIWHVFNSSLNRLVSHLMTSMLRLSLSIDFSSPFPHQIFDCRILKHHTVISTLCNRARVK